MGDPGSAEDVVQETFVAALEGRVNFRGDSAERTWLIGILRHKIADWWRARNRSSAVELPDDDADDFTAAGSWRRPPGAWSGSTAELEREEFWRAVRACLSTMPARQARIFMLTTVEMVETELVCKEERVTPANFWVLMHRARHRLRKCMGQRWFGEEQPR